MRSQRPSLYWVAVIVLLAGALTAGDPWVWPLWLHQPWAHVVEALPIIIGGISTQVFRVWPPACFAIEAVTLTQDLPSPIPNLSDQKSRRRSVGSMGERLILVWAAIVRGTSSVLHAWGVRHDPPFPLADDSLSDELPWPDRETIPVIRPPGRAAYWDPWHGHMNLLLADDHGTTHPKWVQTKDEAQRRRV
jgi:hypothetical protein